MTDGRWRLKIGLISVVVVISSMTLTDNVEAQDRTALYESDWNVAVEQDKLAIKKGCIDPDQKEFLINYTIMAGEGIYAYVGGSDLSPVRFQNPDETEGNSLIAQLKNLPACPNLLTYNFLGIDFPTSGLTYSTGSKGSLFGIPKLTLGGRSVSVGFGSGFVSPVYEYWTHYYDYYDEDDDDYYPTSDEYRYNLTTGRIEIYDDDDDEWYPSSGIVYHPVLYDAPNELLFAFTAPAPGPHPSWITFVVRLNLNFQPLYEIRGSQTAYLSFPHESQTANSFSNTGNGVPILPFGLVGNSTNFSNIPSLTFDDASSGFQYTIPKSEWSTIPPAKTDLVPSTIPTGTRSSTSGPETGNVTGGSTLPQGTRTGTTTDLHIPPSTSNSTTSTGSSNTTGKNELLEDAKTNTTTGPAVTPSTSNATTSTTRRNELLDEAKTQSSTGSPTSGATGRETIRQELLNDAKQQPAEGSLSPKSGSSSAGTGKQELQHSNKSEPTLGHTKSQSNPTALRSTNGNTRATPGLSGGVSHPGNSFGGMKPMGRSNKEK